MEPKDVARMDSAALMVGPEQYNQKHLLKFWKDLTESEKTELTNDIMSLDLEETTSYFEKATELAKTNTAVLDDKIKPVDSHHYKVMSDCSEEEFELYERYALLLIARGKLAVVLMAGGQGTRLGVNYPKGMYDVGLPSHKTLLQLQAERIKRLQDLVQEKCGEPGEIAWYIMTSEATDEITKEFLRSHQYFGLNEANVRTFKQAMIPCYDFDGKILLDEKYKIARAPDGNGGLFRALQREGILDDMQMRGIECVHVHSVDNILIKVADPHFVGYCHKHSIEVGVLVVEKTEPSEAVGVVCQVDDEYRVVEYSEISKATSELRGPTGKLIFNAGNVCNHYFTVDFLYGITVGSRNSKESKLELHLAKKKIPYVDDEGVRQVPTEPNGIKIEKFIFDVFKFEKSRFAVWEVARDSHFSPLKNSDDAGKDCPSTAKRDLLNLHKKWLLDAGVKTVKGEVEISPLRSYMGENLDNLPEEIVGPIVLE